MDRRHVVLGVALAASVADEYPTTTLFSGEQTLDAEPVLLDETRLVGAWIVTVDLTLPAEAADDDFISTLEIWAGTSDRDLEDPASLLLMVSECGSAGVVGGPNWGPYVEIEDAFATCSPEQTCSRSFCVAIGNASERAADVEWSVRASVQSDASVHGRDDDSIPVPLDITIEELEP